jgi:hypothetical protein
VPAINFLQPGRILLGLECVSFFVLVSRIVSIMFACGLNSHTVVSSNRMVTILFLSIYVCICEVLQLSVKLSFFARVSVNPRVFCRGFRKPLCDPFSYCNCASDYCLCC